MPIRKQDYPPDWKEISFQVRHAAGWRCEWCGAPGGECIRRYKRVPFPNPAYPGHDYVVWYTVEETDGTWVDPKTLTWARLRFHGLTKIILTVAHLDRNSQNNDRSNLAALCQRCHLRHDIRQHITNRRYGRDYAREPQTKLEL